MDAFGYPRVCQWTDGVTDLGTDGRSLLDSRVIGMQRMRSLLTLVLVTNINPRLLAY